MAEAMLKPMDAPAVSLAEQIAAVQVALETAMGIRLNVLGKTPEFVALAAVYDQRIAGLHGALATLRKVGSDG